MSSHNPPPAVRLRLPSRAWDSHIHIIDTARYPVAADAAYKPTGTYSVWENALFETSIGQQHIVIIQPSFHGFDNSAVLDALRALGPDKARAVVQFDPSTMDDNTLRQWNDFGVRGVRANLGFVGANMPSTEAFKETLRAYAEAIRSYGWVLQLYIEMEMIAELENFLPALGVDIVFDHMGHPDVPDIPDVDPYSLQGFGALIRLLKNGRTWVKVSAPYRVSRAAGPEYRNLDPLIREFFKVRPDRLVFASDWPHTLFEGLDIKPWMEHLVELVGEDDELRDKLFRENARRLWGVTES